MAKKIKINNYKYTVKFVDETSIENTLGVHNPLKKEIEILAGLDKEQKLQTLIHELTHAYLWSYGFSEWTCCEEAMCNFMGVYAPMIVKQAYQILKEGEVNGTRKIIRE